MTAVRILPALLLLACLSLAGTGAAVGGAASGGWTVEEGTAEPSYAWVEPARTNVNIDAVALVCEAGQGSNGLQLQLYLTDDGPLRPIYPHSRPPKNDPQAEVAIDGESWPVALLFADDFALLADAREGPFPLLSKGLVDAMQAGRTMTLRFDLLAESSDPPVFDGEAVVDLRAPGGPEAIAALRRCAESDSGTTHIAHNPTRH